MEEKYTLQDLKKEIKNIRTWPANLLTLSRLAAPFIVPTLAFSGNFIGAFIACTAFALTDFADGKAARALNGESQLGKKLDPIVDKLCAAGLLIPMIPAMPIMALPLFLEGVIAVINSISYIKGGSPYSNQNGRLKMWPLSASMVFGYGAIGTTSPTLSVILGTLTAVSVGITTYLEIVNIEEYKTEAKNQLNKKENDLKKGNHDINNQNYAKEKTYEETSNLENNYTPEFSTTYSKPKTLTKQRNYNNRAH